MNGEFVIKQGVVVKVEQMNNVNPSYENGTIDNDNLQNKECGAVRIKVRLENDRAITDDNDLPWCFPIIPKFFQSIPKEKECVLVITSELGNADSNRYYIGPVISQPQYMDLCEYKDGKGPATSLLKGGEEKEILMNINKDPDTDGAFPNCEDISIIGRNTEDIQLKNGEIDLRCGIRSLANGNISKDIKGNVIFNTNSPAYLQLKYKQNLTTAKKQQSSSLINLVADKINIISHKDVNNFELTDNKSLIKEENLDDIMSKLHQLPYGDILVEYLEILRKAIVLHTHNFGAMEPPIYYGPIKIANELDFNKILSEHVRIS